MRYSGPAVILLALVAACTESGTEPPLASLTIDSVKAVRILEPGQYPEELPQEFRVPAIIHSVEADAGWSPDGFAYGGGILEFTATSGHIESKVITENGTSPLATKRSYQYLPLRGSIQTPVPTVYMPQCKGVITGHALGRAWNEYPGLSVLRWGDVEQSDQKKYQCPRSTTATTTTPDGGGGGGDQGATCYVVTVDYYWYYPDTGRVEYRYSEEYRWCEKGGPAYM